MDKLEILLDMIEHPERYTEQQISDLLADEEMRKHYDMMVQLRGAYDIITDPPLTLPCREGVVTFEEEATIQTKHSTPSIPLDPKGSLKTKDSVSAEKTLMSHKGNSYFSLFTFPFSLKKIAAIFIAAAFLTGLAWAFVPLLRSNQTMEPPQPTKVSTPLPTREGQGGGSFSFSNLPLDSILAVVSAHYNCEVCFRDSAAMGMKFITTWNPEDSLAAFIEHLNMFDGLRLTLQDDTIFVESTNDEEGAQ
jgi:hypothetical protein